jgi:outer membrane murein-binding lipoprotein Lpp
METQRPTPLFAAAVLLLFLTAGCASNSALSKVQNEARTAQSTADMALSTAQNALSTAQHAQSLSDQANERALRSEEAVNRGFRYSMRK